MGSSPSSPPQAKGKAILLLIIGIYTVSYLSLFILFVYLPRFFIITTRSDCYYTDFVFVFRVSCFVVETGVPLSLQP